MTHSSTNYKRENYAPYTIGFNFERNFSIHNTYNRMSRVTWLLFTQIRYDDEYISRNYIKCNSYLCNEWKVCYIYVHLQFQNTRKRFLIEVNSNWRFCSLIQSISFTLLIHNRWFIPIKISNHSDSAVIKNITDRYI